MKVVVVGLGYVGLSLACLFAKQAETLAVDINSSRVDLVNRGISPIRDTDIESFLQDNPGKITATDNATNAYVGADFIVIATPTNYDDNTGSFDTSSIESVVLEALTMQPSATVVIKSTVPVGYTKTIANHYPKATILFSPEFLREGHALHDNLYPSRIIVGTTAPDHQDEASSFCTLLARGAKKQDVPTIITGSTEAEAIKLFANTYLALRISYFNELDTYAETKGLNARQIIEGVCLDPRIGNHYNNPSFGYGGYCLPKDSKQLLANYANVPQNLIKAVVDSNATRKRFIADKIINLTLSTVGVYRLAMKAGSDNFRQSSTIDIVNILVQNNISVVVYEPLLTTNLFCGCEVIDSLKEFKQRSEIIIANRVQDELMDVIDKVYTRDIWSRD